MTSAAEELLGAFELHDPARVAAALARGVSGHDAIDGRRPVDWLLSMYTRSPRLGDCLRVLVAAGARIDAALFAVLQDDGLAVAAACAADAALRSRRATVACCYTPLDDASLLHVAVEFACPAACRALLAAGADVDARAGVDAHGLGGQTPLFHVVNAWHDGSMALLQQLLAAGARTDVRVDGLVWGRGHEWETTLYDLTPIGYAQFGWLPQMHRDERQIHDRVRALLAAGGRAAPPLVNVPNRYLRPKAPPSP